MAILTDTKARNIKPDDKPIAHGGITGLALHPSVNKGRGKWVLRYVSPVTGKRRNAGLGTYPEVGVAEAGRLGQEMRDLIAHGKDPLEKIVITEDKPQIPTFENAAYQVHANLLPSWKNQKHGKQWISTLEQYVFASIGAMTIDSILPADVAKVLQPIWLEIPETASRVKQRIRTVMAWGWAHGYCSSNPVEVVGHILPQQPSISIRTTHQPAMPWRELPQFVQKTIRSSERYNITQLALEFLILTACRSGEVRGLKWSELDFHKLIWTIPAERMKAGQPHRVPLSHRCVQILNNVKGLHEELVFPSLRDQVELSDMVFTSFLRRVKATSSTPNRVATAHGFRSSFRDWCSEQGYARDLAERALAHTVQNKVEAAYHRTDLLEQRREMMNAWTNFICSNN